METQFAFRRCLCNVAIVLVVGLCISCTSHKYLARRYKDPIHIAIADFSRNPGRFCNARGAKIIVEDYDSCTLCVILLPFTSKDFKHPPYSLHWGHLPSEYQERNGRLFYWDNDFVPVTQEVIDKLIEYHQVNTHDKGIWVITSERPTLHFYFCKGDYRQYIRRIQVSGQRPKCLKCEFVGSDWNQDNAIPIHWKRKDDIQFDILYKNQVRTEE